MNAIRAALALLLCSCAVSTVHGIPNFQVIEPGLYRGGEPSAEGWSYLASLGVRHVVQLDYDAERPAGVLVPDGFDVDRHAMPPSDADDLFRGPTVNDLVIAARAMQIGGFVHCLHGQDRTGIVVATFRRAFRGWTKAAALKEARRLGLHTELVGLMQAWGGVP